MFALFLDLRLESTTFGGIDLPSRDDVRDGDAEGYGTDYEGGIEPVHAGGNEVGHLFAAGSRDGEEGEQAAVHQHSRDHWNHAGDGDNLVRGVEDVHGLDADYGNEGRSRE